MDKSGLQVGDTVQLEPKGAHKLYDGCQINKEQYQEIHQKNLTGEILGLRLENNHYLYGEYATVKWQNGFQSNTINTGWLIKKT